MKELFFEEQYDSCYWDWVDSTDGDFSDTLSEATTTEQQVMLTT